MSDSVIDELKKRFDFLSVRESADMVAFNIPVDKQREFFEAFKKEFDFDMLIDLTAVDWDKDSPRFTVVYHFLSTVRHAYIRLACDCASDEEPSLSTVSDLWPAADWHEREVYDMFGITFDNHPNLTRILMWEGYPYHPLRKEFPLAGIVVELPAADVALATGIRVEPAPMMGGPFHAPQGDNMSDIEPRASDQSWTEERIRPTDDAEGET